MKLSGDVGSTFEGTLFSIVRPRRARELDGDTIRPDLVQQRSGWMGEITDGRLKVADGLQALQELL